MCPLGEGALVLRNGRSPSPFTRATVRQLPQSLQQTERIWIDLLG